MENIDEMMVQHEELAFLLIGFDSVLSKLSDEYERNKTSLPDGEIQMIRNQGTRLKSLWEKYMRMQPIHTHDGKASCYGTYLY